MTKQTAKPNYQLSTPSPEQQAVINALINQQENVVCKAVAGAGKTTLILNLATQVLAQNPHAKILNLTYNKKLSNENATKIKALKIQKSVVAKTFNAFENFPIKHDRENNGFTKVATIKTVVKAWAQANQHKDLLKILNKIDQHNHNNQTNSLMFDYFKVLNQVLDQNQSLKTAIINQCQQWEYICFDEFQDVDPIRWMQALILIKTQPKCRFLILGDPKQTINQHDDADQRYLELINELLPDLNFKIYHLSYSFRITKPIADFINLLDHYEDDWTIKANPEKQVNHPVTINIFNPAIIEKTNPTISVIKDKKLINNDASSAIIEKLWELVCDLVDNQGYLPCEIIFLSPFRIGETQNTNDEDPNGRAPMKIFIDHFKQFIIKKSKDVINHQNPKDKPKKLNVCEQKSANTEENWYDLRFYSFNSFKGCESKVTIVIGNTLSDWQFWSSRENSAYRNDGKTANPYYVAYSRALEQLHLFVFDVLDKNYSDKYKLCLSPWFTTNTINNQTIIINNYQRLTPNKLIVRKADLKQNEPIILNIEVKPSQLTITKWNHFEKLKFTKIPIKNYRPIKAIDYIDGELAKQQNDPIYVRDLFSQTLLTFVIYKSQDLDLPITPDIINHQLIKQNNANIKGYNNAKTNLNFQTLVPFFRKESNWIQVVDLLKQIPDWNPKTMILESTFDLLNAISVIERTEDNCYQAGPTFNWIENPKIASKIASQAPNLINLLKRIQSLCLKHQYQQVRLKFNGFCDAISNNQLIEFKFNNQEQHQAATQLILYNYFLTIQNELVKLTNSEDINDPYLDYLRENYSELLKFNIPFKNLIFVGLDQGVVQQIITPKDQLLDIALDLVIEIYQKNSLLKDQSFINSNRFVQVD